MSDPRISPPSEYEELLTRLTTEQPGQPFPIFATKQKAMMFAAGLGYSLNRRKPIARRGTAIRIDIFMNAADDAFINALAVRETQDLNILSAAKMADKITIFEEYAHGGLIEMQHICYDQPGDPLEALIRAAEWARRPHGDSIDGVDSDVLALFS